MTDGPRVYSRSVSQWKGLTKCGKAFELERLNRKRVDERPAAWSAAGVAFHEALMTWEKGNRIDDMAQLFEAFYDQEISKLQERQPNLELWMKPPRTKTVEQDIKNYKKRFLERDVPNYERRCLEADWEILELGGEPALELEFELDLDGVPVRGALDRIQWWPERGFASIEDTKTGSPDNHEFDHRQLGVYALAAEEIHGVGIQFGRYWFTKVDRGSDWVDLSRYTREYLTEEFHKLDKIVQSGLFLASPGKHCELCPVKPWCPEKGWLQLGESLGN